MEADVPAVVVGAGINGLGVVRSLARAGVRAFVIDSDPRQPAMHSRTARPVRILSLHGDALIDELARLGTTTFAGRRPLLLLTQEESVKSVSERRGRLEMLYRFTLPSKDLLSALLSKYGFQQLAESGGAPIPPLVRVTEESALPKLERLRYPVVVKPAERNAEYGRSFKKAYRIGGAAEAIALVRRMLPVMPDIVVQEWTEGPDASIHFCLQYIDRSGRVTASFTGRKIRTWPPQVGGTASCAPAPDVHAELSALTARFFQGVGAVGMAAMEYKRDARTGEFRMVEPTVGRTDYQAEVATVNGVNLPYAAYCAEVGRTFTPAVTDDRRAWRVRSEDLQSARAQGQRPGSGFAGFTGVVDALWRASDPYPWLADAWAHVRRAVAARATPRVRDAQPVGSKP